jgi:hypothetical protein
MRISGRSWLGLAMLGGQLVATHGAAGCAGNVEPQLTISAVSPPAAYSNSTVSLVIEGGPFRPIYDVDTHGGSEAIELGAFTAFLTPSAGGSPLPADALMWLSTSELAANIPPDIAPGPYDVALRDPRGALAERPMGFVSLGLDLTPPTVKIDEPPPGSIVNAGAEVPVAFEADDGLGTLDMMIWTVGSTDVTFSGSCSHPPNVSHATCRFVFVAPQPAQNGQALNVLVTATDSAGNPGQDQTTLTIGVAPTPGPFAPFEGPAAGGTPFSVRGKNFIAGTEVLFGDALLVPGGGTVVNDTLIEGMTPPHDPGTVPVTIRTGAISVDAAGTFTFVGQPEVLAVAPSSGPVVGCAPVTIVGKNFRENAKTRVWFGSDLPTASPLQCIQYRSPNRIEGLTPPGAGAVTVFAEDPVGGTSMLPLAYTYLDVDSPDGGEPPPGPAGCPCDGGPP